MKPDRRCNRGLLGWVALALVMVLATAACGSSGSEQARVTDLSEPLATPGASVSPSPSAMPSASATAVATPVVTPSATAVATPVVTPSATAVATPVVTPSATAVATPMATPEATVTASASASVEQAAMDAWALVFNSSVDFADKVPHLEDAASLESSNAAYAAGAEVFGGVSLEPTAIEIEGDAATITYNILFGGVSTYEDLIGEIRRVDGMWTVSRETYCGILASARTPCS